jgi:hypothetical protein
MKKSILLLIAILPLFFFSCEKQEVENSVIPDVRSEDGILIFKDRESVENVLHEINYLKPTQLLEWEEKMNFKSIEQSYYDVSNEIVCNLSQYKDRGMTEKEILYKIETNEIHILTDEIRNKIEMLKFEFKKDEKGIFCLKYKYSVPFQYRFLNKKYSVVINDTLFHYLHDRIEISPNYSENKNIENSIPIIAREAVGRTNLKSIPHTQETQLCWDTRVKSTHKTEAAFRIKRYIYYNDDPNCLSDCVWSTTKVYVDFQGYWLFMGYIWMPGNYYFDISGAYDYQFKYDTWVSSLQPQSVSEEGLLSSPFIAYETWERNSDYPWKGFGNVDCFTIKLSNDNDSDLYCHFNLADTYCADGGCGYSGIYKLFNTY